MKHNFKELLVWQKARTLVKDIYIITQTFPKEEIYGLTNQMRRSATSIPSNIAEGCGRGSAAQLLQFLNITLGSSNELETQIMLSKDLDFITVQQEENLLQKVNEVQRMVRGFQNTLKSKV